MRGGITGLGTDHWKSDGVGWREKKFMQMSVTKTKFVPRRRDETEKYCRVNCNRTHLKGTW